MRQHAHCCLVPCAGERINDLKLILGRVAEVSKLLQWHTLFILPILPTLDTNLLTHIPGMDSGSVAPPDSGRVL